MSRPLPGFRLTFGIVATWLSLIVLIPLAGLFLRASSLPLPRIWEILSSGRTLSAFRVSFGCAAAAAGVNALAGPVVAWTLVRYDFPGRRFLDALIDIPFALPTAVAGITLTTLYATNGWVGRLLDPLGIQVSYTLKGIVVALVFVGLPFVIRTVQPVLEEFPAEAEEAAALLGASRLQTIAKVILPSLAPAILTGTILSFARCVGEYGSVVFIAGNMPGKTEILPLLIITHLEEYQYGEATAIASAMLLLSFGLLVLGNRMQARLVRGRTR
jgi:sulfate transport system permease protein